jgi:protein-tyrosine phosphatase
MTDLALVPIGPGALALTHRPKRTALASWKAAGVTHVVTLLAEREGAQDIGAATTRAGLDWIWVPIGNAAVPDDGETQRLLPAIDQIAGVVRRGGHVVVHCSAGVHRTGMFGYALLRRLGLSADEARSKLAELRAVTAEGVGEDRLRWGDQIAELAPPRER